MSTAYHRSRSPVRAIHTGVHQRWAAPTAQPRTWSEPEVREVSAATPVPAPSSDHPEFACPDCGSTLRLALIRTSAESAWSPPGSGDRRPTLRAAPDIDPLPDFEDSIQEFKRELISRALSEHDGVMTRAAKALGLKYTTFVAMVHRLGINGEDDVEASGPQR